MCKVNIFLLSAYFSGVYQHFQEQPNRLCMEYLHTVELLISLLMCHVKHYLTKETLPVNYEVNDKIIKDIRYC